MQRTQWWPVALGHELKKAPLACQVHDLPLVLFRSDDGRAAALPDRCPHRFAPLSQGRVRDGQIECPYHGWRFAADGRCTRVPGTDQAPSSTALLDSLACCEAHGLVWVCLNAPGALATPVAPAGQGQALDTFWMTDQVQCSLQDAAENFLDGFHTHFVHAGWIRHDLQRQRITVRVRPLKDGIEAIYSEEGKQSGLISRMFEGQRGRSMGRFRLPGLAEIEYRDGNDHLNLLVSAWMTPCAAGQLRVFARVATARGKVPAVLKRAVLRQMFKVILRQDRQILEQVSANRQRFHSHPVAPLDGPQDLLGPGIRQLLEQGQPLAFEERTFNISL
ncbi:(2Fe-2S)-binding protein [Pseudomonas sp. Leaf127]|uniref:aromatic ring-hydroxylating oxygenase subunit alpha n=1 Tax=Pseudomonas sp. Leaf127 TaxID=1736267 RepID=UPI0007027701|nr:aromatic ring-hydroxylating dioxygenase subunit alpha [Pseudomonas sp. Leaf127]KQQ55591.1 (2Fe-2S)-binding protein [Pseudomonas sp. Leaf127]